MIEHTQYCAQYRMKGSDDEWITIAYSISLNINIAREVLKLYDCHEYSRYECRIAERTVTDWRVHE